MSKPKPKKRTGKRVVVYRDRAGLYRFKAYARNGRQVGKSEEAFRRRNYAYKDADKEFPGFPIYNEKGELWKAAEIPLTTRSVTDWEEKSLGPAVSESSEEQEADYPLSRSDA